MNSIYIESQTLYQNKPAFKWLDKCGARWVDGTPFEDYRTRQPYIGFTKDGFAQFPSSMKPDTQNDTHTPTAFEFCQGVARILGIPEPTFGENKDKAFWDSEQAVIDRAKNNPIVIDPALYGAKAEPKGMAIECDQLTQDQKELVDSVRGRQSEWEDWSYCVILKPSGVVDIHLTSESEVNDVLGVTITDSPTEFLEYVAQQAGKEYDVEPDNILSKNEIAKIMEDIASEPSYPHKVCRILDTLDGIPLDTRIPLSEWIPPYKSNVIVIKEDWFFRGAFYAIVEDGVEFKDESETIVLINFDGHWMRIV